MLKSISGILSTGKKKKKSDGANSYFCKAKFYWFWLLLGIFSIFVSKPKEAMMQDTNQHEYCRKIGFKHWARASGPTQLPRILEEARNSYNTDRLGNKKISSWQSKHVRMAWWQKQMGCNAAPNSFGSNVCLWRCVPASACKNAGTPLNLEDHCQFPKPIQQSVTSQLLTCECSA